MLQATFKLKMARVCGFLWRDFSRSCYLNTEISLCIKRPCVFSDSLFQPALKTKQIPSSTISLARPQRYSSTLPPAYDARDEKSLISERKIHPFRRTLFVGSLNFQTSENTLKDYFSRYGEIESVRIIHRTKSGTPFAYAFVVFKNAEVIDNTLKENHLIDSRWVDVDKNHNFQGERKIHISDISDGISLLDIKTYFSQFGDVLSVSIPKDFITKRRKDFGFVEFSSVDSALKSIETREHIIKGSIVKANFDISKKTTALPGKILADGLPGDITLEEVKAYFEAFAPVDTIDMFFQQEKNIAFISLREDACEKILIERHFINNKEIIVHPMTSSTRPSGRDRKVFVQGIPPDKTGDDVHNFLQQFAHVSQVYVIKDREKCDATQRAIVKFKNKESVDIVVSLAEVQMDESLLKIRRVGYTAKGLDGFVPLSRGLRRK